MNLEQIRTFVRTQLDLDTTDLPDVLLDVYVRDGYDHIVNLEQRWPFFETTWTLTVGPANGVVNLTPDVRVLESLMTADGRRLQRVDARYGQVFYGGNTATGEGAQWTQVNRQLHVFPLVPAGTSLFGFGYRGPSDWVTQGASAEVDADQRLHIPICYYACSMGYAQQEDEVLEATYLNRFKEAVAVARDSVMKAWSGAPKQVAWTSYRRLPLPMFALGGTGSGSGGAAGGGVDEGPTRINGGTA